MTAETLNFPVISSETGVFGGSAAKIASYAKAKDFDLTQAASAASSPPRLLDLSAYAAERTRGGGSDAGRLHPALPEDRQFPRRFGLHDMAAPHDGEPGPDALSQAKR